MKLDSIRKPVIIGTIGGLALISGCSKGYQNKPKPKEKPSYNEIKKDDKSKDESFQDTNWLEEYLAPPAWKRERGAIKIN